MEKENLKDLSRQELVDALYNLMNDGGDSGQPQKPVHVPSKKQVASERRRLRHRAQVTRSVVLSVGALIVVAAIAVLLSSFVFPVIQVSGDSMEPTLGDGDILVLLNTDNYSGGQLCCVAWQNKLLIKRVIALGGDTVDIDDNGNVFVNGTELDEPYVTDKCLGECDMEFPFIVPEDKVFVMGDRRASSIDSRSSAIGPVGTDQIVGKVLFKAWPLGGKQN